MRLPFVVWSLMLVTVFWFAAQATLQTTWTRVDCKRSVSGSHCEFTTATLTSDSTTNVAVDQIGGAFTERSAVALQPHWQLWAGTDIGAVPMTSQNDDPEQVAYVHHRFGQFLEEPRMGSFHVEETLPWGTWWRAFVAVGLVLLLPLVWRILSLIVEPAVTPEETGRRSPVA